MIKKPHSELSLQEKQRKLLYISELLMKDPKFDEEVRKALHRALKKLPSVSKLVSTKDMTDEEIADINNPIE